MRLVGRVGQVGWGENCELGTSCKLVPAGGDLSVTLSLKPITNFITNAAEYISNALGLIAPRDGTVLTGSSTVIIGG